MKHKDEEAAHELILKIFSDSFTSPGAQFEDKWLEINEASDYDRISGNFSNSEISFLLDVSNISVYKGVDYTLDVLKFQISELHKMRGKQLDDKLRYLGLKSETGNGRYNFDPVGILECGVSCIIDNNYNIDNCDWSLVGAI